MAGRQASRACAGERHRAVLGLCLPCAPGARSDLTTSTDPPDRSLFGRGGFPGTVKLSRKARGAEGEGQQQGDAELQRGVAALALGERPGSGGRRQMVSGGAGAAGVPRCFA